MTDPLTPVPSILMLHNRYQYVGGEDVSTAQEVRLLEKKGHHVTLIERSNQEIQSYSPLQKAKLALTTTWNLDSAEWLKTYLQTHPVDLLHVQNFFPLFSPSVHGMAHKLGIPSVQHLRNFRLGCLNTYLYRDYQICEQCVGCNPWRGVAYRCYRGSLLASISLWAMLTVHRQRKTWHKDVDAFITPSQFAANKLVEIGLPAERLFVKPNFIEDPLVDGEVSPYPAVPTFIFIGRLSPEKGVMTLIKAWKLVKQTDWQLWILGNGPLKADLEQFCKEHQLQNVHLYGHRSLKETLQLLQKASMLVAPSDCYETFGRSIVEAFACGRGALVSDIGAPAELVEDGKTGFLIPYQNETVLAERITWCGTSSSVIQEIGRQARQIYLQRYTPDVNYRVVMDIYSQILR